MTYWQYLIKVGRRKKKKKKIEKYFKSSCLRELKIFPCKQENTQAVVAEWLRRLTRNQIPSGSVGSSPTDRVKELFFFSLKKVQIERKLNGHFLTSNQNYVECAVCCFQIFLARHLPESVGLFRDILIPRQSILLHIVFAHPFQF